MVGAPGAQVSAMYPAMRAPARERRAPRQSIDEWAMLAEPSPPAPQLKVGLARADGAGLVFSYDGTHIAMFGRSA